jgi:hypothetical protein
MSDLWKLWEKYKFRVVITSDWRNHLNLEQITSVFYEHFPEDIDCLEFFIEHKTINLYTNIENIERDRCLEILSFMNLHKISNSDIIILDDMDLLMPKIFDKNLSERFVYIADSNNGISNPQYIGKITKLLNEYTK